MTLPVAPAAIASLLVRTVTVPSSLEPTEFGAEVVGGQGLVRDLRGGDRCGAEVARGERVGGHLG